jgi:prepilin-type processing-associated H-X9-DG protein
LAVRIKNYGSDTLTSVTVNYTIDNGTVQSIAWSGTLAPFQSIDDTVATITLLAGMHYINAYTSNPNAATDDYTLNDAKSIDISVSNAIAAYPFAEGFEGTTFAPADWFLSSGNVWSQDTAVGGYGNSTKSARANFYTVTSGTDNLATMRVDLTNSTANPYLAFSHAYARYSVQYSDTLAVSVSSDCGVNWTTLFSKHDSDLATVSNFVTLPYSPAPNEWTTTYIDLSAYMGQFVKVRFEAHSGYGNYLFLDDINIFHSFTAVEESIKNNINVYPNPTTGMLNITDPSNAIQNIEVYDQQGKLIFSKTKKQIHEPIDMTAQQQSLYFIKLQTTQGVMVKKVSLVK